MARRAEAADTAREARAEARAALADAEREETSIQARTDELVRALAEAQQVSVRLAERRQTALAEAAALAAQEAAEQEAAASEQGAPARTSSEAVAEPSSADPPAPSAGAAAAIAFARRQLGEPYVYGAAGPASWDCSGLTSQAWAAAGQPLSHWSVAQYGETTPIRQSQLRPGDLVFWSEGSPRSIYHVAMYLGDGLIIQAPRPGRSVEIVSMYYWITPDLFGRV
jgi:cell wall-associated NlpC family hydrolase